MGNGIRDILVIRPFNSVFFGTFGLFILLLVIASLLLKGKDEKLKKIVIVTASLLTLAGFFVYKYCLSIDPDYDSLRSAMDGFNWWGELPLHLCNINMILIPIAVLSGKEELKAFCFFVGPLGAMMALTMPGQEFNGFSILLPRMLGYYGTHFLVVIEGISIVTFGLYKPKYRDLPRTAFATFAIAFIVFMINMIMRWTGLYSRANYFFSVETEGNFLLEIFHSWIPYPFLYLIPCILILAAYMVIVTSGFYIGRKISGNDHEPEVPEHD